MQRMVPVNYIQMHCGELVAILEGIHPTNFNVYCIINAKAPNLWASGPARLTFQLENDKNMYILVQSDLAFEFSYTNYSTWVNYNSYQANGELPCVAIVKVPWTNVKMLLTELLEQYCRVCFVPCSRATVSWELFNYYWSYYFSDSALDIDWE